MQWFTCQTQIVSLDAKQPLNKQIIIKNHTTGEVSVFKKAFWWQTYCCGLFYINTHMVMTHYNCMVHSCEFPMEDNTDTARYGWVRLTQLSVLKGLDRPPDLTS